MDENESAGDTGEWPELCFQEAPGNGPRCTQEKGHDGDHIAESVRKGNVIGRWPQ